MKSKIALDKYELDIEDNIDSQANVSDISHTMKMLKETAKNIPI